MKSRKAYSILVVFNFIFLFKLIAVSFNMPFSFPPYCIPFSLIFHSLLFYLSFIYLLFLNVRFLLCPWYYYFLLWVVILILIQCNSLLFYISFGSLLYLIFYFLFLVFLFFNSHLLLKVIPLNSFDSLHSILYIFLLYSEYPI